jgi:branched-chain amino acid transport system substrate-binding protein
MALGTPGTGRGITRRELMRTSLAVGVGGVVVGAGVGYAAGKGGTRTGDSATSAGGGGEIKVVGIFPLTGFIAADGKEMRNGTVMAIDEINEMGGLLGKKLRYVEIDDKDSLAEDIPTAFNRAVDVEKPDVVISGYHLGSGPEFDILANAGRLYYNVNTQQRWVDRYTKDPAKYWSIFQTDPTDTMYGKGFALWLDNLVKTDPYDAWIAQNFGEKIKELGWTVTAKESFAASKVADWGPLLSKARQDPPGILFTTDYSPAGNASMAKQFAANPIPTLLYQQYGPSVPEYMNLAGDAANGIIWATVLGRVPDQMTKDWMAKYKAKFGAEPGWANAPGNYDTTWFWAKSVALAGTATDYKRVAQASERLIHRGITGSLRMVNHAGVAFPGETNDPSLGQAHIIVQIQNKEHRVISPVPWSDGEFQQPRWLKG